MNKEQLKEAVGELNLVDTVFEVDGVSYIDTAVSVMQVYDLIDQLDEPAKVVVPKFVDDFIEWKRTENLDNWKMASAFISYVKYQKGGGYEWSQQPGNMDIFLSALINGYEVEKEKQYYVLDKQCKTLLGLVNGKVSLWGGYELHDGNKRIHQLTEKQIKNYDERFWPFAVEVAE